MFHSETRGRQCSCNSLAAICLLRSIPSATDLDNSPLEGNLLYIATIKELKQKKKFKKYYLSVDELPSCIEICNNKYHLLKGSVKFGNVFDNSSNNFGTKLSDSIQQLFDSDDSAILVLRDYMVAVFKSEEGLYVLFDPHARNANGEVSESGNSIWMGFFDRESLVKQIERLALSIQQNDFQYELVPITVRSEKESLIQQKIIPKGDILQNDSNGSFTKVKTAGLSNYQDRTAETLLTTSKPECHFDWKSYKIPKLHTHDPKRNPCSSTKIRSKSEYWKLQKRKQRLNNQKVLAKDREMTSKRLKVC